MTMEPRPLLGKDEAAALVVALAAHVALVMWLMLKPPAPAPLPLPERMTVTISNEVADQSTSPDPNAQAAPAIAPVIAENPVPEPAPAPEPQPAPAPQPVPRPVVKPAPQPVPQPRPVPKPAPRVVPAPAPRPVPQPPKPQPAKAQPAKPQPAKPAAAPVKPTPAKPATRPAGGGGSRIGSDFLKGIPGGQTPGAHASAPPAQAIGPAVKSALSGAIARQLRPYWAAPQGAETDQLVTILDWDLNSDGSLSGPPRLVAQLGINDANRAQAKRHAELAMRAVQLAAPFDLPAEYYLAWRHIRNSRFDRNSFK